MKCDNPTVRRQELGHQLRMHRTQAGFTLDDAALVINCSVSKLSRIETGHRTAPIEEIASLLGLYRADHAQRTHLLALAREADAIGWLQSDPVSCPQRHTLTTLESQADQIVHFDPIVVPAALQISDYTAALLAESDVTANNDGHSDTRVRAARTRRRAPAQRLAILDESVLHRPFGGPGVLRRQLEDLHAAAAESHWTIRVVPRDRKITTGPFTLLRLPGRSPVICLEHLTCTLFLERPDDVEAYEQAVNRLEHHALDETATWELIAEVAKLGPTSCG